MSGVRSRDLHIRWQIIEKTLEGLTTRQIAKRLGISKSVVSRICQKFKKCVMRITNKQLYKHVIRHRHVGPAVGFKISDCPDKYENR